MNWIQRLERLQRKTRRARIARNLRAFRARQKAAGIRRVALTLTGAHIAALQAYRAPGETTSAAIGRMIEVISGNP
jgi:hypothetical protein